jgi:long-chain acyl-CoA synthetase
MSESFLYLGKPWLKSYPSDVPAEVDIPKISLCQAFDRASEKWRDHTALIFYGRKISFGELREKIDRTSTALYELGIRKGDVVALLLLTCTEHIIAFYAALKAGATVTPISPVYVSPEIKYQLENSGAKAIICQDMLWEKVEKTGIEIKPVILTNIGESLPVSKKLLGQSIMRSVYQKMAPPPRSIFKREGFYQLQDLIKNYPPKPPKIDFNPQEDVACLPYTGGTTGPPKGVMLTHTNYLASDAQFSAFFPFLKDGEEVGISYMPLYHLAGQFGGIIRGILHGYTQILFTTPDIDDILSGIEKYKATNFGGAPTLFELLKTSEKVDNVNWKKLKIIISGADALHEATAKEWFERTGTWIHDCWGMTETAATGIYTPIGKGKIGSIGVPLPGCMAGIADPDEDKFLTIGEIGEIVMKGSQVFKGYWKNPEAYKENQAVIRGETWFRTGDLGRMDEDGYFFIYDRKRDLIKYKGLRIHAREVEEVIKTHPNVKEVGVIGIPERTVGENVKAYVVLEGDARGKVSEADINEYCRDKLAHYKIPKIIEFVGEIPKTDVGKVSRRELREMEI